MKTIASDVTETNIASLKQTLHGASYPLAKSEVIELAELNFADGDMLDVLYALGDSDYYSLSDIRQEIQYLLHADNDDVNRLSYEYRTDDDDDDDDGILP